MRHKMGIAKKDTKVWHLNYGYLLRFCVTDVKGTKENPPPGEMDGWTYHTRHELDHALNLSWVYKKSSCWWGFG
ncbi:hypothetical protein CR513_63141 [Mucuna pruriens]|uniref:Uncharacterized protein n=1 Tax=Mucuna pruriens TaxID=157652 RepID=A0A371DYI0_MUCPR|nr:hypothetical protein CR513_63141 [Mucuna pruriens]